MLNNNVIIRPEKEDELNSIYSFIKSAFSTAKVFDGNEQDFAVSLRESNNYIAEQDNELVGHIMLTKTAIIQPDGRSILTLLLAPIAVKQAYRNQGISSTLIDEACKRAKSLGYSSVFLVGEPNYYARFGFKPIDGSLKNVCGTLAAC